MAEKAWQSIERDAQGLVELQYEKLVVDADARHFEQQTVQLLA